MVAGKNPKSHIILRELPFHSRVEVVVVVRVVVSLLSQQFNQKSQRSFNLQCLGLRMKSSLTLQTFLVRIGVKLKATVRPNICLLLQSALSARPSRVVPR